MRKRTLKRTAGPVCLTFCAMLLLLPSAAVNGQQAPDSTSASPLTAKTDSIEVMKDSSAVTVQRSEVKFFTLDHALFRYDDTTAQLELYTLVSRPYLGVEEVEEGYRARYEITFMIKDQADSLLIGDSWVRTDYTQTEEERNAGQKIPELTKYRIPPGTYRVAARVVDLVKMTYYTEEYPVTVEPFSADSLALSEIILASRIEPSENAREFDHNGLLVLPNAERMFGLSNPQVFYYLELYNLTQSEEATYTVQAEILMDDEVAVKELSSKTLTTANEDLVEYGLFNIATIQTGTYTLRVTVTDNTTGATASRKRMFWVYRPGEESRTAAVVDAGFDISGMSDEEVATELNAARYIMSDRLRDRVQELESDRSRRAFLTQFWAANDPDPETKINEFREEYVERLRTVNGRYGSLQREGWETDRGRVYLIYGEPSFIEDHPFDSEYGKAYQVWEYDFIEGGVYFVFVDRNNLGRFVQVHSTKKGELENPNWWQQELR